MTVPTLTAVRMSPERADPRPLVVLGPSLGVSTRLWQTVAADLAQDFDVVAWDLPGHGVSAPASDAFSIGDLATAVLDVVDRLGATRFSYAGDSVGGAVGLQLAVQAPDRVAAVAVVCSGARIGDAQMWADRAATVRRSGTPVMIAAASQRWFAPGFLDRAPEVGGALLGDLQHTDAESYALACGALADFDAHDRLSEIAVPVLAISGALDVAAPPELGRRVADGVQRGRFVELPGVAHLAPVEAPAQTAALLRDLLTAQRTQAEVYDAGMAVRREVLGAVHVDRATAAIDETTRDFQTLITRYAWGSIWTRPGLDRRSRSMITLTALIAHGHWEELAMHTRAALTNGLTRAEITEVVLQSAIYCSVPSANSAFRVVQTVFRELDATDATHSETGRE